MFQSSISELWGVTCNKYCCNAFIQIKRVSFPIFMHRYSVIIPYFALVSADLWCFDIPCEGSVSQMHTWCGHPGMPSATVNMWALGPAACYPGFQSLTKWVMFYCCFGDLRILAYKIAAYVVCMIWQKQITACKIQCQLPSRGWINSNGLTNIYNSTKHSLAMVSPNIYKMTQMNMGVKVW